MKRLLGVAIAATAVACAKKEPTPEQAGVVTVWRAVQQSYGTLPDSGGAVQEFTLGNARGIKVKAISYGAIITSIQTPDKTGALGDIVYGYDSLGQYVKDASYFGAVVGRFANRVAKARFTLDGKTYTLATNDGANSLHGGKRGFNKVLWKGEDITNGDTTGVRFRYTSRDGEEGYPGTLQVAVSYRLTPNDELIIDYEMTTDKATPVNVSQHTYWNLHGGGRGTILDHLLTMNAAEYTPVDSTLIPTGAMTPVAGTPFDFRTPTAIGARIGETDTQLRFGKGYDHNWAIDRKGANGLVQALRVVDPVSGRTLDIATTEPGMQFYSGNFLDGSIHGRGGEPYIYRGAIVLEPQHYPDSPNQKAFPNTILKPGETLRTRSVYTFGVAR